MTQAKLIGTKWNRDFYNSICSRFHRIDECVTALALIKMKVDRDEFNALNYMRARNQIFKEMIKCSQHFYPPREITTLLPEKYNGILVTANRLSNYNLAKYHLSGPLPIVSSSDKNLCKMLIALGHVARDSSGTMHLTQKLTNVKFCKGEFAVYMVRQGEKVK